MIQIQVLIHFVHTIIQKSFMDHSLTDLFRTASELIHFKSRQKF